MPLPDPPGRRPARGDRGPDRFAWRLASRGRSLQVDVLACLEIPRGWRAGERIPLKDLPSPGTPAWSGLGPGEQAALAALRAWSRDPAGLPFPLLAALEGHTRLSWSASSDYTGDRVALARKLAALEVREAPDGWRLRLDPRPGDGPARLRLEGDRLLFTGFGPVHRRLDELLGDGRSVPRSMGPRLAALLGRILPHLPLLTDLRPEPEPPDAAPDRSLCLWVRGGGDRLDLRLRVRPAPALPWALPGEGFRFAVAGVPGARTSWRRDFLFEQRRAGQVRALLPGSAKPLQAPLSWRIEGREAVAGFLAALRGLGARIRLEGVPGLVPSLPEDIAEEDLRLELAGTEAAPSVRGSLRGRPLAELLPALRNAPRFMELEPGRLLDLSGLLGARLRQLAAWGREESGQVRLPAAAAPVLRDLGLPLRGPTAPPELPGTFMGELRPYQKAGFQWMARLLDDGLGACLADDMGLGKTVQTAALLARRAPLGSALVVCPTSVALNWAAELARFTPGLRVSFLAEGNRTETLREAGPGHVVLASYGLLGTEGLQDRDWATVVLDEAHAIKNPETQRAQACRQLRSRARLALTGTPVENHPGELVSLLDWLLPGIGERFQNADLDTLRLLSAPFLLRRRKAEVLTELPPRTDLTVRVELDPAETDFHRELLASCRAEAQSGGVLNILAALMKLRRACAHPALVDPDYPGAGAKVDLLLDRLETLREEGHRSLVFSQFTDLLDLVQARLARTGITFRRLDGSMAAKARQREVAAFQKGEADVFLLSLRAGGTGLNLTAADDVFHLDPWWNPAVEDQASDRAHRMGRTRPVTVHRLVAAGTVEERVLALHAAKRAMVEHLLEGREEAAPMDRETLLALLG
ncbi:MAG TPA: DEAD/DEAH box helicase [Holophaga sp.]|nr:DEAD/DEAH box helicase [Holophaga sp.]